MAPIKSLAEQVAELEDPVPQDFDPEDDPKPQVEDDSSDTFGREEADRNAREHYLNVGKSELRNQDEVALGPEYQGTQVNRDALYAEEEEEEEEEDDDDDDPFPRSVDEEEVEESEVLGSEDDDKSLESGHKNVLSVVAQEESKNSIAEKKQNGGRSQADSINGKVPNKRPAGDEVSSVDASESSEEDDEDQDMEEATNDNDEDEAGGSEDDSGSSEEENERTTLRKMMSSSTKTLAHSLSVATQMDIQKGRALKRQRLAFDALLNTRIKLQKALVATNTIPTLPKSSSEEDNFALQAAESAALKLWTTLDNVRSSLPSTLEKSSTKRKRSPFSTPSHDTPLSDLWTHMQAHEKSVHAQWDRVLNKWSSRLTPATSLSSNKLNPTSHQQTPLSNVLSTHLNPPSSNRLFKRVHTPRSCAPIQSQHGVEEDPDIYDDGDFYQLLLRDLVDQKMQDSSLGNGSNPLSNANVSNLHVPSMRETKVKKHVDTRASKGRKMRYNVHEKLQSFMVPEDRGIWTERAAQELFGSLLGKSGTLQEEEGGVSEDEDVEIQGLKLFRG
ncbi:MAG: rRNA-processing protein bfr2 [Cirrosporium novae-zelandiae]|nr:MAG: rRNA-processing protein bfr2 [Cirrosporium novae-zelandiae]